MTIHQGKSSHFDRKISTEFFDSFQNKNKFSYWAGGLTFSPDLPVLPAQPNATAAILNLPKKTKEKFDGRLKKDEKLT